jgi:hypothetical protein
MSIKPSAAAEVRSLIAVLAGPDEIKREAAIARLAVLGPRAVDRLLAAYADPASSESARIAILRIFEAVADPRPLPRLRDSLTGSPDVALAGIGALRGLLAAEGDTSTDALDALVALVVDRSADRRLRLAAFDALRDAPADVQEQLRAALRADEDAAVRAKVEAPTDQNAAAGVEWDEAIAGKPGSDPAALLEAAATRAATAPLGELQKLIDLACSHEATTAGTSRKVLWQAFRGELHWALARRGSTVARYDLRESLEGASEVLPEPYVAALQAVGDPSCLEPAAAAYARIEDAAWRARLADAMGAIVSREKLGPRHPAMKKIAARWPEAYEAISTPSRTTPRQKIRRRT